MELIDPFVGFLHNPIFRTGLWRGARTLQAWVSPLKEERVRIIGCHQTSQSQPNLINSSSAMIVAVSATGDCGEKAGQTRDALSNLSLPMYIVAGGSVTDDVK